MKLQHAAYLIVALVLVTSCAKREASYEIVGTWESASSPSDSLLEPMGVDVASTGAVFVSDARAGRVVRYAPDGTYELSWQSGVRPVDVAVGDNGIVYVADFDEDNVLVFDLAGRPLGAWGTAGTDLGQLSSPAGIAVAQDGSVYVADFQNHRVQVFNPDGTAISLIGSEGHAEGELYYPTDIALASNGTVWVADAYNHRLHSIRSGAATISLGTGLRVPVSAVINDDGTLHVADSEHHRLVALSTIGEELASLPIPGGSGNGLNTPGHIARSRDGTLYVTDPAHGRILVVRWNP